VYQQQHALAAGGPPQGAYGAPPPPPPPHHAAAAAAYPPHGAAPPSPTQQYQQYQHSSAGAPAPAPAPPMQHQRAPAVFQPHRPAGGGAAFAPPPQAGAHGLAPPPSPHAPPSPAAPPPAPAGPPPGITVAAADVSAVPPELRGVARTVAGLHAACEAAAGAHPARRREVDDAGRKLGALLWRLNAGEVSPAVGEGLRQLCGALDAGDYAAAAHVQVALTTSHWDECAGWLTALKRLIKAHQTGA
jgi:protein transport protein SEC31